MVNVKDKNIGNIALLALKNDEYLEFEYVKNEYTDAGITIDNLNAEIDIKNIKMDAISAKKNKLEIKTNELEQEKNMLSNMLIASENDVKILVDENNLLNDDILKSNEIF